MVHACYALKDVFQALANHASFCDKVLAPTNAQWTTLQSVIAFLQVIKKLNVDTLGSKYSTLSMQPFIYDTIVEHCTSTMSDGSSDVRLVRAAKAVKLKMEKYKPYLHGTLPQLALLLDPRLGNIPKNLEEETNELRLILKED